jgi:toxin CcdB
MARFDIYRSTGGAARYLLDVQSELLDHLRTRVVIPLMLPESVPPDMRDLHPRLAVEGIDLLAATQLLATVKRRELGPVVANAADQRDTITRALDLLLTGF